MNAKRRKFFRGCLCCEPSCPPASPARRNFLAGGVAALGLGATGLSAIGRMPAAAQAPAAKTRIDVHHHYIPPFHADVLASRAVRRPAAAMVAGQIARGHGQERHRDLDRLRRPARHLVRKRRGIAQSRPSMQRIRRQDGPGSPRPLRTVRHHRTAGYRGQPGRNRVFARRAQGRGHRAAHQLRPEIPGRPLVRPGLRGAQPAQGRGLRASDQPGLLPQPGARHSGPARSSTPRIPRAPSHISSSAARRRNSPTSAGSSPTAAARCHS